MARQCGLSLDDASVDSFRALFTTYVDAYNTVAAMPDEASDVEVSSAADAADIAYSFMAVFGDERSISLTVRW